MRIRSQVTRVSAATPEEALAHFGGRFAYETDCWDVHDAFARGRDDFVLVDVRSRELFERGHVPGAVHVPHESLTPEGLEAYPMDTLFVVYCSGPHCNGASRGAVRLARLGRPVKEMVGGIEGWKDEGFELARG